MIKAIGFPMYLVVALAGCANLRPHDPPPPKAELGF
jgi:hypothetical protein